MRVLTVLCMFVVVLSIVQSLTYAQGFYSVHSPNGVDVWAVGSAGSVYHSFDGGVTWGTYPQGFQTLHSVYTLATNVWMVGDNGTYLISTNGGGSWNSQTINGGTTLQVVTFVSPLVGWAAGNNGTILKTTDGGWGWTPQSSGTLQTLSALAFVDLFTGYASGEAGVVIKTTDGGSTWNTTAGVGWTKKIFSVAARGGLVYVAGADEFCCRSTNGGLNWDILNFKTDSHSDVLDVCSISTDTAVFVGGGGFIRTTTDGGQSFRWGMHQMHAKLNDVFLYDGLHGWACSEKNFAVLRTTDGGANWLLPQGTTVSYAWAQKFSGGSIGNTFMINPWNKDRLYVVMGSTIYMSADRGETWSVTGNVTGGSLVHSFYISPKDTNVYLAASEGAPDKILRSTNRGSTWSATIAKNFTSYGMPIEMDPDHPDTLFFAPDGTSGANGVVYRSTNFGATWDSLTVTTFRSPCDIVVVPDSAGIMYVGDGVTGSGQAQMWRSTNGGFSWTSIYSSSSSEIPMIAISRLRKTDAYATAWSSTGVTKTTNVGASWPTIATTSSTWGADVAKDDPNVVLYGTYGGGTSYLSTNAGASFTATPLSGSNSGILCYDRATFLAHQAGNGVWKFVITYAVPTSNAQAINLLTPNGNESWQYNTIHNIAWTSGSIPNVKIEYKTSAAGLWQTIAANTTASGGLYPWTVPNSPTTQARVRISDVADGNPVDSSNNVFAITVANISVQPGSLDFGSVDVGLIHQNIITIYNTGTATLVISNAMIDSASFAVGRSSFSLPAGSSDTLSVIFSPTAERSFQDTLRLQNSSPNAVLKIPLAGVGQFGTPQLITPVDAAPDQPVEVELVWNPVVNALTYHVQLAQDSSFAQLLLSDSSLAGTARSVGLLENGITYHWRVRGRSASTYSPFSAHRKFSISSQVTNAYPVANSWNLVSLPLHVEDARKTTQFPTSISNAYAYSSGTGYVAKDTLRYGGGYWLKFGSLQNVAITGQVVTRDTVDVTAGWNLVGSLSSPAATSLVLADPPGIIGSAFYGYGGAYVGADTLQPLRSYWVKALQDGRLILNPLPLMHAVRSSASSGKTNVRSKMIPQPARGKK